MKGNLKKRLCLGVVVAVMTVLLCFSAVFINEFSFAAEAATDDFKGYSNGMTEEDLYAATNTYAYNGVNRYDPKTDTMEYRTYEYYDVSDAGKIAGVSVSDTPQITVLTHGLGGDASHWSNAKDVNGYDKFAYSAESLISKIDKTFFNEAAQIYWAKMDTHNTFYLIDLKDGNNQENGIYKNGVTTPKLIDVSKHIIVVFEATSRGTNHYNNYVYEEFNYMLSKLVYDVRYLSGKLPKINLIGHSRGGITNLQYALDHPDLVASMFGIGTPYFGSNTAATDLGKKIAGDTDGRKDIIDSAIYNIYYERWAQNGDMYHSIKSFSLGGYSSVDFVFEALELDTSGLVDKYVPQDILTMAKYLIQVMPKPFIQGAVNMLYTEYSDSVAAILESIQSPIESNSGLTNSLLAKNVTIMPDKYFMNDLIVDLPSHLAQKIKKVTSLQNIKNVLLI